MTLTTPLPSNQMNKKLPIIAHRGASTHAPENTLAAFRHAIDTGASMIECDIQLTADHVPVIFHDTTVARTTNASSDLPLSSLSYKELRNLDAGTWFNKKFAGEAVPSLSHALDLSDTMSWYLELKTEDAQAKALVEATLKVLGAKEASGNCPPYMIGSMNFSALRFVAQHRHDIPLIAIVWETERFEEALTLPAAVISLDKALATEEAIAAIKEQGKEAWIWTVDQAEQAQQLRAIGADAIVTNDPQHLIHTL